MKTICFLERPWRFTPKTPMSTSLIIGSVCVLLVIFRGGPMSLLSPHSNYSLLLGRLTVTWKLLAVGGQLFSDVEMAVSIFRGLGKNIKWYEYSLNHLKIIFFVKSNFQDLQNLHHQSKTNQRFRTIFFLTKGFFFSGVSVSPLKNGPANVTLSTYQN